MRVIVRKSILLAVISSWWLLAIQTPARAQGWSNGYANRHTVTIDHTKVPNTDQANFSMLFSGTYAYLATTSNGGGVTNSNGYDIIFTSDANGTSVLPFEQESYNGTTGAVNYWVQIPTVSHTTDTVFYLFYGKSSVTTDQSNRNGTWDSSYKGVWHFNQTPSGTGAEKDSTVNGYNGTPASSGISLSSDGIAGSSLHFDGTSYSNNVAMSSALPGGPPLTVSIWVKTTGLNSTSASGIMDKSSWQHTGWSMWDNGQWDPHVFFRTMPNWTNEVNMNRSAVNDGNWHYLVGTINSSDTITFYLDGAVYGTVSAGSIATDTADAVTVGAFQGNSAGGSLTEVRISSTVRSADWIAAEYNNVTSPWLFYDEGSPLILSLSPTPVYYGTSVTVTGKHFGSSQGTSTITFSGTAAAVTSWSDTSIVATVPFGISPGNVVVTVSGATSHVFPFNIFPTGWTDQDVGGVSKSGSASYGNDTFTVSGDGSQLWNTADAFNFAYQTLSGDGTIIARLDTLQGIGLPQAGVMIRETLTAGSTYAAVEYGNNGSGGYYPSIMWRTSTGGSTSGQSNSGDSERLPLWMKLVRSGSTFTAYESTDGVDWTQLGSSVGITMATSVYVGLFANSGDTSTLGTATFDNVSVSQSSSPAPLISGVSATTGPVGTEVQISGTNFGSSQGSSGVFLNHARVTIDSWSSTSITITIPSGATSGYLVVSVAPAMDSNPVDFTVSSQPLPDGWLDDDIGTVGISGSATYSSGTFTANGAGAGIGPTADGFHFVYQRLSGDGTIVARLASVQNAYAGVMIRETLTAGSTLAFMERGYANIGYFTYRTTTGGSTSSQQGPYIPSLPYWLKVTRSGSTFAGYTSTDGVTWTQAGTSQTITMATSVYIGLAVTSNSTSSLGTATFDNVTTTGGEPPPTPAITSISPTSGGIGASVTLAGYYFGASQGSSQIKFNGVAATSITSWSDSQIVAAVPSSATTGPVVVVVSGIGSNNNYVFTVYNPVISSLSPSTAPAGASVTLAGSGFGAAQGSSTVQFNSVAASVSSWSNTSITVTVPANAASGPVTVTEGGITSNGVQFTALGTLSISSISSSTGPIGMSVTFAGTGFGSTQGSSTATFNSIVAAVTSWSNTQIVAVVPLAASPGPVSVAVDNLTAQGPTFTPIVKATVTDSLGNSSSYTAAVNGGEWRVSGAQGSGCSSCTVRGAINYGYDAYGHVTSLTDPKGNTATYTYDSANNLLSETHPVDSTHNATSSYTYNSFGEPLTVTDALGNVTTNTYDSHGNLTSVTTPAPNGNTSASVTQFAYNSLGELSTITDPLNHVTTLTYTTAGLVATITDAQNHVTTYGYDAHGNRTSVKDANNQTTTFAYDAGDRLTTITYPDNTTTIFAYDTRGRRTSVTDQNGKTTTYAYDDADRLTSVTNAANQATTYAYDTENNLTTLTDANTHSTFFTPDAFGRVTKTNFPSSQSETYAYDANNNLTSKTDRKGQTITYTYDDLNRLTSKTYADTTSVTYTYDLVGKVLQVTDPTGTYAFAYDNMGRPTGTTTTYSFLTGRNFTTSYSYDAASNRIGFTDPEGGTTGYTYDTLNRLTVLAPPAAFGSGSFGFSYDVLGRRTQMTRPNNVTTNYTYDNLSRLSSVLHQMGSSTIDGASYGVDNTGNRTFKTDLLANVTSNYAYDALHELTQVTQGNNTSESYSYDPVHNRLSSLGVPTYSYNNSNELTSTSSATYTYDNNGNVISKTDSTGTTTYAWDVENRLTSVTLPSGSGTVTFKYDPFGRRIYKSSSVGTTNFSYSGSSLIETVNSSGGVVARYVHGVGVDEPLAVLQSNAINYYEADGLGSITSLTSPAGAVAQTYAYDSFGKQTAASGSVTNPFRYAAREFDTETSLAYNRARYYDPAAGRFLNEDPMRFEGGSNFYAYTRNNSTNYADPSGLCPEPQTNQDPCAALGPGGGSISVPSPYGLIALQFNSSGFLNGFSVPLTGGSGTIQGGFHIGPNTRAGAGLSANGGVTIQFSNPILAPGAYPGTGGYIQSATFSGGMFTNVTGAVSILGIPLGPTSTSSSALLNYLNGNPLAISFANDLLSLLQYTSNNISCEFLSGGQ